MKPGFVYVIKMSKKAANVKAPPLLIKVGQTGLNGLDARRRQLNTGNPYRLDYFARWKVTDTEKGEKKAQASLKKAKPSYGGGREWYFLPKGGFDTARKLIEYELKLSKVLDFDKSQNM